MSEQKVFRLAEDFPGSTPGEAATIAALLEAENKKRLELAEALKDQAPGAVPEQSAYDDVGQKREAKRKS